MRHDRVKLVVNGIVAMAVVMVALGLVLVLERVLRSRSPAPDRVALASSEPLRRLAREFAEPRVERGPLGYCDLDTTPQEVAPCDLDRWTRSRYRRRIRSIVRSIQTSWAAAIASLQIAEKLERGEIRFEPRLGQRVLAAMFDVIAKRPPPPVPRNAADFLEALHTAPMRWGNDVTSNIDQMFDADLAAVLVGLPEPIAVGQQAFEDRVMLVLKTR